MKRRVFLSSTATAATVSAAGCLSGSFFGGANHQEELRAEVEENRGVEVRGLEVTEDNIVRLGYTSEQINEDLAEVAMAFVERVNAGWNVARLRGLAHIEEESDVTWYTDREWAEEYLDGEIDEAEYGQMMSETIEQTTIIGEDDLPQDETDSNETARESNDE